jgi:hypothetical protein
MPGRQQIADAIAAVARKLGRAPSRSEFISLTGISEYYITRFFSSWNAALTASGLEPRAPIPIEDHELFRDWGEVARRIGVPPSRRAYRREGKYDLRTLERRFCRWSAIPCAFTTFAQDKAEWADVKALVNGSVNRRQTTNLTRKILSNQPRHATLHERITYGNPVNFDGFRHEPANEQGVVLLFGMLAKELGYVVEAIQNCFPDCEAKRQIAPNRWQRVFIEFEFESRNFRDHGHPATGCDMIVCWRHNWPDCPPHLEILELSQLIKSASSL